MWAIVRGIDSPVAVFVVHRRQRAIVTCVVTCVRFSVKANPSAGAYASTAEQSDAVRSVVILPPCSMCRSLHFGHHRSIVAEVRPCCNAYARSGWAKSCGVTPTPVAALGAAPSSPLPAMVQTLRSELVCNPISSLAIARCAGGPAGTPRFGHIANAAAPGTYPAVASAFSLSSLFRL